MRDAHGLDPSEGPGRTPPTAPGGDPAGRDLGAGGIPRPFFRGTGLATPPPTETPGSAGRPLAGSELDGRVALVLHADAEPGQTIARELARAGALVILQSHGNGEIARRTLDELHQAGRPAGATLADLGRRDEVERMFDQILREFRGIDVVIAPIPAATPGPLLEISEHRWDESVSRTLRSALFVGQAAARRMIDQGCGGRLVFVAARPSDPEGPARSAERTARAGLVALTESMAVELAAHEINVNVVLPGLLEDPPEEPGRSPRTAALRQVPKGRFGRHEEIAAAVLFLASSAADYVTGTTFRVDGGFRVP